MNTCPQCNTELRPMGGCSAHPDNWYCPSSSCGWEPKGQTSGPRMTVNEALERMRLYAEGDYVAHVALKVLEAERGRLQAENQRLLRFIDAIANDGCYSGGPGNLSCELSHRTRMFWCYSCRARALLREDT